MAEDIDRIGSDLIRGVKKISAELGWSPRQTFHAHEAGHIPTFKIGRAVCARRSTLRDHITRLERETRAA